MDITVNGTKTQLTEQDTLETLVLDRGLNPQTIVIEHNGNIVMPDQWRSVRLSEEDCVEIISFVGGG